MFNRELSDLIGQYSAINLMGDLMDDQSLIGDLISDQVPKLIGDQFDRCMEKPDLSLNQIKLAKTWLKLTGT